jgi:hypothetical protein
MEVWYFVGGITLVAVTLFGGICALAFWPGPNERQEDDYMADLPPGRAPRVTVESVLSTRFYKVDGITRVVWFPRWIGPSKFVYDNRILLVAAFGRGIVIAPFRPTVTK